MASNLFENFVREVSDSVAAGADPRAVAEAVSEALRRLLAGPFFLDESRFAPTSEGFGRQALHGGGASRFRITASLWQPKQATPIHDHATWGVVAALGSRLISTTFRRVDDGSTPGYASLSEQCRTLVTETSHAFVRPPEDAIHCLENPYADKAVTIHVFGQEPGDPQVYDLKAKSIVGAASETGLLGI